jgi:hypothetical protein
MLRLIDSRGTALPDVIEEPIPRDRAAREIILRH